MPYHVVKGEMQYNILLIQPWIDEMYGVSSLINGYFKYLYGGKTHCILVDSAPFSHCILILIHTNPSLGLQPPMSPLSLDVRLPTYPNGKSHAESSSSQLSSFVPHVKKPQT